LVRSSFPVEQEMMIWISVQMRAYTNACARIVAAVTAILLIARVASAAPAVYTISAILPMTGIGAAVGVDESTALRLYEARVNATGGIRGAKLQFDIHDDQSSPQVAVQETNLILQRKPAVILGSGMAAQCQAMASLLTNGPVQYCLSTAPSPPRGYVFAAGPTNELSSPAMMKYFHEKGYHRLAIISTIDSSGQIFLDTTLAAVAASKDPTLTVVASERFNPTEISVTAQLSRIDAAQPQVLLVLASGTPFGTVLHGMHDAGMQLPVFASPANMNRGQLASYSTMLPNSLTFLGYPYQARDQDPMLKSATTEFYDAFKSVNLVPTPLNADAWDPANIVVNALRALGTSATAEQLRDYIGNLNGYTGVFGEYDFRKNQHGLSDPRDIVIVRWDQHRNDWIADSQRGGGRL
jgi:branched-chain amino acid transport system substrate-binding protein